MGLHDGTTEYEVIHRFAFSDGKILNECTHIKLFEPTSQHTKYYMKLRQMVKKAEMDMADLIEKVGKMTTSDSVGGEIVQTITDKPESEHLDESKRNAEGLIFALEQSARVELFDFLDTFKNMVLLNTDRSIASVEGRLAMKKNLWDKIHPDDQLGMAVWWSSFFVTPSDRGQTTSESPQDFQLKDTSII